MRFVFVLILTGTFILIGGHRANAGGITDDDIENRGLQLLNRGYGSLEIIGAKAEYVTEHTADVPLRVKKVHLGTTYQELMKIWSGWKPKTDIHDSVQGTVMTVDYVVPTLTDTLREVPVHIIYTVTNGTVIKIDSTKDREKNL